MSPSSNTKLSTGEPYAATIAISAFLAAVILCLARPRLGSLQGVLPILELYTHWFSLIVLCCLVLQILWAEFFFQFKVPGLPWESARSWRKAILQYRPVVVGGTTVLAIGFGLVHSCSNPDRTTFEHVEQSIKLLTFNAETDAAVVGGGLWRDVALTWAAAALFLLAFEAIVRLFSQPVKRLQLSLKSDHLVVCGLGQLGEAIARQWYVEQATDPKAGTLVVIESNPANPNISLIEEEFGGLVHIGDGTDEETLRIVSAHRARTIFAVMHDDDANVECVRAIHRLIGSDAESERRVVLHLLEGSMVKLENQVRHHRPALQKQCVQPFNVVDQSLNQLFAADLLERRPQEPDHVAHFVVIGFSPIAEEVILRIGEQAHYENRKRSRVTVVHAPEESSRVNAFLERHPQFFPPRSKVNDAFRPPPRLDEWRAPLKFAVNGGFFEFSGRADADLIVNRIARIVGSRGEREPPLWMFVCLDDEKRNTALAIELQQELLRALATGPSPAVVLLPYVSVRPLLSEASPDDAGTSRVVIKLWGDTRQAICNIDLLRSNPYRCLAFACHKTWAENDTEQKFLDGASWKIHSSLMSALHLHAKFAGQRRRLEVKKSASKDGQQDKPLNPPKFKYKNLRILAEVEKNRWNAERLIAGWSVGKRDDTKKLHHLLIPWSQLASDQQLNEVRNLTKLLNHVLSALGPQQQPVQNQPSPLRDVFTIRKPKRR